MDAAGRGGEGAGEARVEVKAMAFWDAVARLQALMLSGANVVVDDDRAPDWAAYNLMCSGWQVVFTKPWYYTYPDAFNYIRLEPHEAVGLLCSREYPARLEGLGAIVFVGADAYPDLAKQRLQELVDARRITLLGLEASREYSVVVCARQPYLLPPTLVAKGSVVLVGRGW